jgi:hypothetical protein
MLAASNKPSITTNPAAAVPLDSGIKLYLKNDVDKFIEIISNVTGDKDNIF